MALLLAQHATLLESDLETPVGLFIRQVGEKQGILLESTDVDGRWGRYSVLAADFLLTARCHNGVLELTTADPRLAPLHAHAGKPYFEGVRGLMQSLEVQPPHGLDLPAITRGLYGYLGYGAAGLLEPALAPVLPPQEAEACLVLPGTLTLFDHVYNRIIRLTPYLEGGPLQPLPETVAAQGQHETRLPATLPGKEAYVAAVARVKEQIAQGEAVQVVLSTSFSAPLAESPFSLYRRLRRVNPSSYMFYMRLPGMVLLGSSPEVLVTCEGGTLRLCPIAGTRPRSKDAAEDAMFGDDLLQDPKEKAEHVMLVDLGRNDLGRVAVPGTVNLERFMEVERFSHVMHLTSRIRAELAPGNDAIDVLAATFPAGTVSGAPKVRAMQLIAEEEAAPRGPYAGAIGWLGLDKTAVHLDFGITIRSMWVRQGQVRWQAGAGIVYDSVPEKEWAECQAKAAVIRQVVLGEESQCSASSSPALSPVF